MNKKMILLCTVIATTVVLSGCVPRSLQRQRNVDRPIEKPAVQTEKQTKSEQKPVEKKVDTLTFSKAGMDVEFDYPKYFQELDSDETSVVYKIAADGTNINLVKEVLPMKLSLEQYVDLSLKQFQKDSDVEILGGKNYTLNGIEVNETISLMKDAASGLLIKLNQICFIHNGSAYIFTYGSPTQNYDKNLQIYGEVIKTVRIKGQVNKSDAKTSNSSVKSEDPVYQQMMDPNTELGKIFQEINKTQGEIEKASEERSKKEAEVKKEMITEKQAIIELMTELKLEKQKYANDKIKSTQIQGQIDILQTKLDTWYKDIP